MNDNSPFANRCVCGAFLYAKDHQLDCPYRPTANLAVAIDTIVDDDVWSTVAALVSLLCALPAGFFGFLAYHSAPYYEVAVVLGLATTAWAVFGFACQIKGGRA